MAYLSPNVLDDGLNYIVTNGDRIDVCSSEPANYSQVATYSLGYKTAPTYSGPANRSGGGREITIQAITDGVCGGTGTGGYFAITDGSSELIAAGPLSETVSITSGNTLAVAQFKIGMPGV